MIKVQNLTKLYKVPKDNYKKSLKNFFWPPTKDKIGVKEISFEIEQGEIVGFVGPNGAGKTTTIKMLSGILTPTEGQLQVCGYIPYQNRNKYTKEIGVLMGQKSVLFYDIPVIESFKFYKDVYGLNNQEFESRLNLLVDKLDIRPLLNIPVRKLSLGQRMRCEIVASILHNPKILFLDEPTLGLDVIGKQIILEFLQEFNQKFDTTIFLTTHDLNDIDRLCERIIILDEGQIRYDGGLKNIESRDKYKIVEILHTIDFNREVAIESGQVLQSAPHRTRIKIAKKNLSSIISILNESPEVMDININLISLEEIIKDMYTNKEEEQLEQGEMAYA